MSEMPAVASDYQPDPEMKKKLGDFLEHFAESGNVQESAELAGINRTSLYRIRNQYPPLDEVWTKLELERRTIIADAVRQRLIDKALVEGNTHAIIHADRIYNKRDYQQEKKAEQTAQSAGVTIIIATPAPPAIDEIPEGDPARIIEILPAQATVTAADLEDDEIADDSFWEIEEDDE